MLTPRCGKMSSYTSFRLGVISSTCPSVENELNEDKLSAECLPRTVQLLNYNYESCRLACALLFDELHTELTLLYLS